MYQIIVIFFAAVVVLLSRQAVIQYFSTYPNSKKGLKLYKRQRKQKGKSLVIVTGEVRHEPARFRFLDLFWATEALEDGVCWAFG